MPRFFQVFAVMLLFASVAEARTCLLSPKYKTAPAFAEYAYGISDSIALVRIISVSQAPGADLGVAAVETVEVLKGEPTSFFSYRPLQMTTPKVGESRIVALDKKVANSCLNFFVGTFSAEALAAEFRNIAGNIAERKKNGAP